MSEEEKITIEDLAAMVKRGFDKTAQKDDVEKINEQLTDMNHKINQIDRRLFSIEEDVAEIKTKNHKELEKRVTFIENKLGIEGAR
jgi:superfamily II RNA helicase